MSAAPTIHANCVVVGEAGVLIRGPSGAGKSSLSLALIERAEAQGLFARLVADDRVRLAAVNGRLLASPPATLSGLVERRGLGISPAPWMAEAVVRFVVDIEMQPERSPDAATLRACLNGVWLPRLAVMRNDPDAASLALFGVRRCFSRPTCDASTLAFAAQHEKVASSAPHAPYIRTSCARVARGGPDPERNEFCAETA
ncbi:HPr kinase/phosphorylase [Hansschlegelia plantiphila]|uniref:HPr kinase/phosphorylase C-terminal domain-containing protein n=1 Tax=Hansschlegelia plantiphila TaxID=374655 RepID=A0A9W6J0S5_9HYPH|nr:HPr kinase/phosphatase C-terminal domain-containing protein [Hansschlegelia plantiphila]GLK67298.1 hypothetical protein GCM10008179_09360 [Hansschlegelia plantiphila]